MILFSSHPDPDYRESRGDWWFESDPESARDILERMRRCEESTLPGVRVRSDITAEDVIVGLQNAVKKYDPRLICVGRPNSANYRGFSKFKSNIFGYKFDRLVHAVPDCTIVIGP
jgi:hypothetical protein